MNDEGGSKGAEQGIVADRDGCKAEHEKARASDGRSTRRGPHNHTASRTALVSDAGRRGLFGADFPGEISQITGDEG